MRISAEDHLRCDGFFGSVRCQPDPTSMLWFLKHHSNMLKLKNFLQNSTKDVALRQPGTSRETAMDGSKDCWRCSCNASWESSVKHTSAGWWLQCEYCNNKPPIFDGLYHMVIRGIVYYCYTNIRWWYSPMHWGLVRNPIEGSRTKPTRIQWSEMSGFWTVFSCHFGFCSGLVTSKTVTDVATWMMRTWRISATRPPRCASHADLLRHDIRSKILLGPMPTSINLPWNKIKHSTCISQTIHGAGIWIPTKLGHVWGFYVGKYTSTMDDLGLQLWWVDVTPSAFPWLESQADTRAKDFFTTVTKRGVPDQVNVASALLMIRNGFFRCMAFFLKWIEDGLEMSRTSKHEEQVH